MGITKQNKSRLRHYIGAPKRFLSRARDLYVDSMLSFDVKVANAPATHVTSLPKNFGGNNCKKHDENANLEEIYRSISRRYNWNGMEFNNEGFNNKAGLNEAARRISGYGAMDRSYSVALGKIGTINEEEPCDFQEDVAIKREILFPRSRSHAVARKNVFHY